MAQFDGSPIDGDKRKGNAQIEQDAQRGGNIIDTQIFIHVRTLAYIANTLGGAHVVSIFKHTTVVRLPGQQATHERYDD